MSISVGAVALTPVRVPRRDALQLPGGVTATVIVTVTATVTATHG